MTCGTRGSRGRMPHQHAMTDSNCAVHERSSTGTSTCSEPLIARYYHWEADTGVMELDHRSATPCIPELVLWSVRWSHKVGKITSSVTTSGHSRLGYRRIHSSASIV